MVGSDMAPDRPIWPNIGPRWPPGGPNLGSYSAKMAPRRSQGGAQGPKEGPMATQEGSQRAPRDVPRGLQEGFGLRDSPKTLPGPSAELQGSFLEYPGTSPESGFRIHFGPPCGPERPQLLHRIGSRIPSWDPPGTLSGPSWEVSGKRSSDSSGHSTRTRETTTFSLDRVENSNAI